MKITEEYWLCIWKKLNAKFSQIFEQYKTSMPKIRLQSGHRANESFAFSAFATFTNHPCDNEKVIDICVDIQRTQKGLMLTYDICRFDGHILSEGPKEFIDLQDEEAASKHIKEAMQRIESFIDERIELIRVELLAQ